MSTPPPSSPAAPAAPASAPAAPSNPPPAPPAEARIPGHANLMKRLFEETASEPEGGAPAAPAAPDPAAPAAPAAPATPAAPAAPEGGIRSRKPAPPKRPDLPLATPAAPPAAPAAAPKPPESDEEFEKGLVEGEKQMIDDARSAEKFNGAKHKGLVEKTKTFIKAHQKFLEDHPDIEENDPAYLKFLTDNRPSLSKTDAREIEENRIAERARGPVDERVNKLEHEIFVRDETPKIEQFATQTYQQLAREALPKEIQDLIKEKGSLTKEIQEQYADELETAHNIFSVVADDLKEFKKIATVHPTTKKSLVEYDDNNPQHQRLAKMVSELCEEFKNTASPTELQRNGKWFVTRDEYSLIDPARRGEFWSFTNDEIMKRAIAHVPKTLAKTIEIKQEALTKRGWVKKPAAPAAPAAPATPPPPGSPPAIRPSPVPGGGNPPAKEVDASTRSLAASLLKSE